MKHKKPSGRGRNPGEGRKLAARREEVWRLRYTGATVPEIARELGVSVTTVGHDIRIFLASNPGQRAGLAEAKVTRAATLKVMQRAIASAGFLARS